MARPRTRVEQIRQRLTRASRAFAWMGAVGIAKDDIVYLLNRVDWLEQELKTYREREAALSQVPSTNDAGRDVESTRVGAYTARPGSERT